ncbi:MAG: hypothetical protein LKK12_02110 [Bacteroidales bacterium]|nr:hypothetical protein [Bacteroidales bacterium]MCI2133158.1 hypothetical protein [Bacteroidales bacterium]
MMRHIAYLANRLPYHCAGSLVGACGVSACRKRGLGTMSYLSIIDGNGDQNPTGLEVIFPSLTLVLETGWAMRPSIPDHTVAQRRCH